LTIIELYRRRLVFNQPEIPRHQRLIEGELERTLIHLKAEMINEEDYKKTLSLVERLHGLLEHPKSNTVSKDTLLTVGANLFGIILIIKHENVNVITSKALSFLMRPR